MKKESSQSFVESLQTFLNGIKDVKREITVREFFILLKGKGAAAVLILFSLPFCLPVQIPGFSTPFGIFLAFTGVRIAFAKRLWWPKWILNKKMNPAHVEKLIQRTIRVVLSMQKLFHPRLTTIVFHPWLHRLHGVLICVLAILLSLPLPVPMTNLLSAFPILFMGIGLLEDDGVAILISYLLAAICFAAFWFLFFLGKSQLDGLWI